MHTLSALSSRFHLDEFIGPLRAAGPMVGGVFFSSAPLIFERGEGKFLRRDRETFVDMGDIENTSVLSIFSHPHPADWI